MKKIEICALCGKEAPLLNSHIIPKFVTHYLKKNTGTGFFVHPQTPNFREQYGEKMKLLCVDCENRFSRYETYFSKKIFYPYVKGNANTFENTKEVLLFVISISWRILKVYILEKNSTSELILETEKYWRGLLLNEEIDVVCRHSISFFDFKKNISSASLNLTERYKDKSCQMQRYFLRSTDYAVLFYDRLPFVFFKFPKIMFLSSPHSKEICWSNERFNYALSNYLVKIGEKLIENPPESKTIKKIESLLLKNPEKYFDSESFKIQENENSQKNVRDELIHIVHILNGLDSQNKISDANLENAYNFINQRKTKV